MKTFRFALGLAAFLSCSALAGVAASTDARRMDPSFFAVLRAGDARNLRDILDKGAVVDTRDSAGNTPLILAALYGNPECLRILLARGADVNATNNEGASALIRAAGKFEMTRVLLEHGADVNARSALGNSALLLASRTADSHRSVQLLLEHGADAKTKNNFGATPLMAAAAGGDVSTVKLLLQAGVDVNAQPAPDNMGFILGGGRNALMWAAFRGHVAIMKLLIDAGADVNAMGGLGTALAQASWSGQTAAARLLLDRGARVNMAGPRDGYAPLHWAASGEESDSSLARLLLEHGADPNLGGGEPVDSFVGVPQTPLMLARRRGESPILAALIAAGATNATADSVVQVPAPPARTIADPLAAGQLRDAIARAVPLLQQTSIRSKKSFINNGQNCVSCHQQHLPMAALGFAKKQHVSVDEAAEQQLIEMVRAGELLSDETDLQPLFHPEAVHTKGYELLAFAGEQLPADEHSDAWVNHLAAIQGASGQWYNNLPRPPLQTGDIGGTALAIHALQRYPLPGRRAEFAERVDRARRWLWNAKPKNTESRIYQLLGLSWAGEPSRKLQPLARALIAEQRKDGGWAQLPGLNSDAYATAQAVYALQVAASSAAIQPAASHGIRWLVENQLDDGTWYVRRRAFPFQPTLNSGFPHGRDSWISASATSWAVMALSVQIPSIATQVADANGQK